MAKQLSITETSQNSETILCYRRLLCKPATNKKNMSWQRLWNDMQHTVSVRQTGTDVLKEQWPSSASTRCFKHWYLTVTPYSVTSQKTLDSASTALWEPPWKCQVSFKQRTNQLQYPQYTRIQLQYLQYTHIPLTGYRHKYSAFKH